MVKLEVRFHSPAAAFLAGEQVKGEVIAQVESPTEAHQICVHVFGHAFNRWEAGDDRTYIAEVKFINEFLVLWKPSDGNGGIIEPGNYCLPFSFVIPPNALPNHRSLYGCVDYWCNSGQVVQDGSRPTVAHRQQIVVPFVVANIVDLNAVPSSPGPIRWNLGTKVGWCSGNGVLRAEFSIDKFGYVGGEEMLLRVDIDSASSVSIRTIHIRIIEEWTYKAFAPYRSYSYPAPISDSRFSARDLVSFKEAAIIRPHDSDRYERRIRLPALQSSYASSITLHKFYLQVSVSTGGICSASLCGRVPFYVGTVPLRDAQTVRPRDKVTVATKEDSNTATHSVAEDEVANKARCCPY